MPISLEERLAELETRIAFMDDTMGSLSEAVAVHDRLLHDLRNAMDRLHDELVNVRGALDHDVHDEPPPPHY